MPRTKEQYENMRLNSKIVISETALKLFANEGYHSTSISKIAKEAGIATGLMYNYYKSKEDLLESIIDSHLNHMFEKIMLQLSGTFEPVKIIDLIIETIISEGKSWRLIVSVMFQPDVSGIVRDKITVLFNHQEGLFEEYYKKKKIKDPKKSARVLSVVLHQSLLYFACTENAEELKLVRNTVIEKLLAQGIE